MDKKIYVVFTHGTSWFSKAIETVEEMGDEIKGTSNGTDFIPTHAGMINDKVFQEALASGFVGENIHRYTPENIRIYELHVTDPDCISAGNAKFKDLLGSDYSPHALLCGAAFTLLGKEIPGIPGQNDCSGDITDVLRSFGFDIYGDTPSSDITPDLLMGCVDKMGEFKKLEDVEL
jgi:hypothetical protein